MGSSRDKPEPSSFPVARNFRGRGPRSLVSMCVRALAINIELTCAADIHAAGIPLKVLENIWFEVKLL